MRKIPAVLFEKTKRNSYSKLFQMSLDQATVSEDGKKAYSDDQLPAQRGEELNVVCLDSSKAYDKVDLQ